MHIGSYNYHNCNLMDLHTDPTVHDFQGLREKIRQEKDIDSHDVQLI